MEDLYAGDDATLYVPGVPVEAFESNEGLARIQRFYDWILDQAGGSITVERVSPVIRSGDVVAFMVHDSSGLDHTWSMVFSEGKVAREWKALYGS